MFATAINAVIGVGDGSRAILPLASDIVLSKGVGSASFSRASSQYATVDGVLTQFASGVPAFDNGAFLAEPAGSNKCTCYGVPRADSYGATLATGNATKGKVYEIVTITAVDWDAVGTLLSGTANTIGAQYVITGALTFTANDTGKECIDAVGTKAYHDGTAFVNPITNMTLSGDVAAVLSIALDADAVTAAGLDNVVNGGKVYKLDNSLGSTSATVGISPTTGVASIHSYSIYGYRVNAAAGLFMSSSGSWNVLFPIAIVYNRVTKENFLTTTGGSTRINVSAAGIVYFIIPQLEQSSVTTSIMPTVGAAASRAATVATIPVAGNLSAVNSAIVFDWTPKFSASATITEQCLISSYTDADNELTCLFNGTTFTFRKRVGGTNHDATIAGTATANVAKQIVLSILPDNSTQLQINGVAGTANADTTAVVLGTNIELGSCNSLSQMVAGISNLKIYNRSL